MAGRYTQRRFRPQYNPISFEQFAQAPLAAQMLHDQTIGSAQAQQEYLNNLPWHEKQARELESNLAGQIDSLTKKITSSDRGIYDVDPATELANIATYKREKFAPGQSQIQGALANRQALKEDMQKLVNSGKMDSEYMQRQLSLYDKQSRDLAKEGQFSWSGRVMALDPNAQKLAIDYISSMPKREIVRQSGWEPMPDGTWRNNTTKEVFNVPGGLPEDVLNLARNYLATNPDVQNYLRDQSILAQELDGVTDLNKFQNDYLTRSSLASVPFGYHDTSITQDLKNQSKYTLLGAQLQSALNSPIIRTAGYTDNPLYNEDAVNLLTDPDAEVFGIFDMEGNVLSDEQVSTRFQANGLDKELADDLVSKIRDSGYLFRNKGESFTSLIGSFIDDHFKTADLTSEQRNTIAKAWGEMRGRNYSAKEIKELQTKELTPLLEQYNNSLPEGATPVTSIEEFQKIYKQQIETFAEVENRTVDYNIESNDLVAQDLMSGNLSALLGKSITIRKGTDDDDIVTESGKDAVTKLESMIAGGAKVTKVYRTASGKYAGGRKFTVQATDGTTHTIYTEPLSINEQQMFDLDQRIFTQLQDPSIIGNGQESQMVPHPSEPGVYLTYQPLKAFRQGALDQKIQVRAYDEDGQRIDNGVTEIGINQFIQMREADRKPYYEEIYRAGILNNKTNPYN